LVISAVPLHDIGGGSRSTQLALELVAKGFHVAFIDVFGADESVDLGIRHVHPGLEQYRIAEFCSERFLERTVHPRGGLVLVQVPAEAVLPIVKTFRLNDFPVVYDLIDDWSDPQLGGRWFRSRLEQELIHNSDGFVASSSDLVARLQSLGAPEVTLVPNAVNAEVFGGDSGPVPVDFPVGAGPVIGYHGSLYGGWIDWDAIEDVANHWPNARVVLIGDRKAIPGETPSNVSVLGLKPHTHLPAYVGRFDVGLVPFLATPTTHAVSPLKVYEYLAMGVPVAAPPLRALEGLPGVVCDSSLVEATRRALVASRPDSMVALGSHSWSQRLDLVLDAARVRPPDEPSTPVRVEIREPYHYSRNERLLDG
jgi:hypothetical protein